MSDFFSSIQIDELKSGEPHAYTEVQQGVIITSWSIIWLQKDMLTRKNLKFFMAGRTLGDIVENHHSNSRQMNKNPSPLQIERISKSLAICEVLGNVKGFKLKWLFFYYYSIDVNTEKHEIIIRNNKKPHRYFTVRFIQGLVIAIHFFFI